MPPVAPGLCNERFAGCGPYGGKIDVAGEKVSRPLCCANPADGCFKKAGKRSLYAAGVARKEHSQPSTQQI